MASHRLALGIFLFISHFASVSIDALGRNLIPRSRSRSQSYGESRPRFTTRLLNSIEARLAERYRVDSLPVLNTANRVRSRGYPFEAYNLQTEDGYGLELHRIPHGAHDKDGDLQNRPAVLLNHGTFQSSLDWVINYDTNDCLAFLLADAGYDVWLANSRGNIYSNTHEKYKIKDPAYWNFTHHEMAVYDLPVTIDCILNTTKQDKLTYIGYSLTSATLLILLSEKPDYNDKISSGILLAPSVYTHHGRAFRLLLPLQFGVQFMQNIIGPYALPAESVSLISNFFYLPHICDGRLIPTKSRKICRLIRKRARGRQHGSEQSPVLDQYSIVDSTLFTAISSRTLLHLLQATRTGKFQFYDYGNANNLKLYQTSSPPEYKLGNVKIPVRIFYSDGDIVSGPKDIQLLASKLPNVAEIYRVPDNRFKHPDFSYSGRASELVYQHLLEALKMH